MRPKGSADGLEYRRRCALALLKRRLSLSDIARTLGCAASFVMRWRNALREGGPGGLKVWPTPGRPTKLTAGQRV
jgi:transposase